MSMTLEQRPASQFDPVAAARILDGAVTQSGQKLLELSAASPVLLVFLRHAGCTFCRETLADLALHRPEIEANGTRIVIVHMGEPQVMQLLLERNNLASLDRIVDATQDLYRAFGLKRGTLRQLFGLTVLNRAFLGGALARYGIGPLEGDSTQMPGLFVIYQGSIIRRFRHRTVADRPDYSTLAEALPAAGKA